jgi:cytochrome c-type biogenesis protein CcmH
MKRIYIILCAVLVATGAFAVQPDEILADPALETRAREISKDLRCLVCQNESIDDSNASLARDLRLIVRERLVAGDSDQEVKDFIVDRYGEFALLRPKTSGANVILWWSGPLAFLIALIMGALYIRSRSKVVETPVDTLNDDEQKRLNAILGKD